MPIRPFLDGHSFDAGSLGYTPGYDDPIRKTLAGRLIELAQAGERDPERLCDAALKDLLAGGQRPQSSSASRFTAGAAKFFILSQSGERPER